MNADESKRFVRELLIAFPAFDDAARNTPDIGATHRSWAAAWDDIEYYEAAAVLARLVRSGEISWDEYRTPGPFIRRLCLHSRKNRPRSESELVGREKTRREIESQRRAYQGSPMALALVTARQMKLDGAEENDILARMDQIMGVGL